MPPRRPYDRIADVIESTTLRGIYDVRDEFSFSTDESVAQCQPAFLKTRQGPGSV